MKRIDHLDITISNLIALNVDNKLVHATDIPVLDGLDIPEIEDALDKLVELGYAGKNPEEHGYYLKFDGRLFYEKTPKLYKGQPFKYHSLLNRLKISWTITKTVGVIINAIALIVIGVWTVQVTNKTNEFENKFEKQQKIIDSQKRQIELLSDSLVTMKNQKTPKDTTKSK